MSITASQSYASSTISPSSDHFPSPAPSPSASGSMSRWKSVFRIGNGNKNPSSGKGASARPTFLAGEGKENAFVAPEVDEMGKLPTRIPATRANTAPNPAVYQQQVEDVDENEEKQDGEGEGGFEKEYNRDESSGSSFNVQLGAPTSSTSHPTSLHPTSPNPSTSNEAARSSRPYSTITTDTSRSSHSSGSRHGGPSSSNISPSHYSNANGASSASLYTSTSTTPHRNTLGLGFKSRIFSSPASAGLETGSSFLSMSGNKPGRKEKKASTSSRKKSGGESSISSHNTSPRTPHRFRQDGSSSNRITPPDNDANPSTPAKSSAAARFLRRVVSAPNTKALFGANNFDVPPLPSKSPRNPSPIVIIDPDASQIDLTTSPPESATAAGSATGSPILFTPSPNRVLPSSGAGGLSITGTRGSRSLTAGAAHKKEAQAALGIASESHHKQVFRRTYSSNSIKTRTVEVGPSSFQKIKLLGKGDVGKVYLVREKKTDKLFAMKGESVIWARY